MVFELRLTFSGLTALVPRKDAGQPDPADLEWLVVMPELRQGRDIVKGDQVFTIAPHQAVLVANAGAVKDMTKDVRLRFRNPVDASDDKDSDLLFQLNAERLEIDSGVPESPVLVISNDPQGAVPQDDEIHDIKWVPPIDACLKKTVPFNRNLIDKEGLPARGALAGLVRLDRGTLETRNVHRSAKGFSVFEFRTGNAPKAGDYRQALSDAFHLRVPVEGDTARLILTDHGGNERSIVVGPYGPKNEEGIPLVEIKVFNEELESILGFAKDSDFAPAPDADKEKGDIDFVVFYMLSTLWDQLSPDELAIPYLLDPGGGGDSKPCEPPKFSGMGG